MYFWTSAVLLNVEKMTIAGVVGRWYFKGEAEETYVKDQTLRNLKNSLTKGFGTVCFASLILAIVQTLQVIIRYLKKVGGRKSG
jgi:hypothetical protein